MRQMFDLVTECAQDMTEYFIIESLSHGRSIGRSENGSEWLRCSIEKSHDYRVAMKIAFFIRT